ncbi:MAG: Asp23/Gls24 family envelope stress response protein [Clostridia bacterium]
MSDINNLPLENKGKITCNRNILLSIISLATKEISGVAALCDNFLAKTKKIFTKNDGKGVKIKFDANGNLVVEVFVRVFYGFSVPDVAYRIQENIKNNISSMVDMKTAKVNVHIVGVSFQKEEVV